MKYPKLIFPFLLIFFIFLQSSCLRYRFKDKDIRKGFKRTGYEWKQIKYDTLGGTVRYIKIGKEGLPKAVILHGSPGTGKTFLPYTKDTALLNHFQIILIDRPGYGKSNFGKAETSISKQVDYMEGCLNREFKSKGIGMATSYGGPVLAEMAYRFPEKFKGILLVSPSLGPGLEKTPNMAYLLKHKGFNWLFPNIFVMATREKFAHKSALEQIEPHLKQVKVPVTHLIGEYDKLIYPSNLAYGKNTFKSAPVYDTIRLKGYHFLTYRYKNFIINKMCEMMK